MKNVFYKMYSMLGTIVRNVEYNAPKRLVQLYSMLNLFFIRVFLAFAPNSYYLCKALLQFIYKLIL